MEEFCLLPGRAFRIGKLEFESCRFNTGKYSDIGLRNSMEDSDQILHNLFIDPFDVVSYYAVYDGHGGSKCSEYLKENLHKYFKKNLSGISEIENWPQHIYKACLDCDQDFREKFSEIGRFMGSAAIVCLIVENKLIVCNIGDSRVVISRNGQAVQLSADHKPDLQEERKRIEDNGGIVLFGRVMGKLAVSRAFGDFDLKTTSEIDKITGPLVSVEPEINIYSLTQSDEFIIVGCDGLFEAYTNQKLVKLARDKLRKMHICEQDPQRVMREIVSEAVQTRSTSDNVTALLIALSGGI